MKYRIQIIATLVIFLANPKESTAFDFGASDWLSGQNAMLAQLVGLQIEQLTQISVQIANIKMLVKSANEGLSFARTGYRELRAIGRYRLSDLARDAKRGLYEVFPEIGDIEMEVGDMVASFDNRENGGFGEYAGIHDAKKKNIPRRYNVIITTMLLI